MSDEGPQRDQLIDEAINLAIRLQSDPDNPVSQGMVRAWRARSPLHEKTWLKVAAIHGATGKVLTARRKKERRKELGLTRRNLVIGGIVGLGAVGAGTYILPAALVRARADFVTAIGEIRRIELSDGSVATLGPDSAIALDYADDRRRVDLLEGMSFFEVVSDRRRPFSVRSNDIISTARGTAFDVSSDAGVLTVSVDRGLVDVHSIAPSPDAVQKLEAGDWASFNSSARAIDRGKREPGQIAAWRDRLVIAEHETVSMLVARIGRWVPGRIIVADPFVGAQRVSGIFDLNDPIRALEAVVHPAGGNVHRLSSYLTVIAPI